MLSRRRSIFTPGERGVFGESLHAGSENEPNGTLRSFASDRAGRPKDFVKRQEFAALAERPAATNPATRLRLRSADSNRLSGSAVRRSIDIIVDRLGRARLPEAIMGISHYTAWPGLPLAPSATAFHCAEAGGLNVRIAYTWNDPATGQRLTEWADESMRLLRPSADERIYANFQTYETKNGATAFTPRTFLDWQASNRNTTREFLSKKLEHRAVVKTDSGPS
jgi:hypothetical protein